MPNSKNVVVLVVISFLLMILLYTSTAKFDIYAKPKNYSDILCTKNQPPNPGGINYSCCYFTNLLPDGKPGIDSHEYCADCQLKSDGSYACGEYHQVFRPIGNTTGLPGRLGTVQPPPTPPPPSNETHVNNLPGNIGTVQPPPTPPPSLNAIPPPSALPSPTKQQTLTTTCPNGLPSDANGNCPPTPTTNTNQQSGLTSNNNNPTSGHHKGSNNQPTQTAGGGQELTATKKHKGSKTDQGTTQPPS